MTAVACVLLDRLALPDAFIQQPQIVGDEFIVRILAPGLLQRRARAPEVAAQHVGVALIVEDLDRRPDDADRLPIGTIGEIETAQPVVGRRQSQPGLGVTRMQLDRVAEILLGQPVVAVPELQLAAREVVVWVAAEQTFL